MDFDATGKVSLDHVYNQPDPRPYFQTLRTLDYRLPQLAKPYFSKIIDECRQERGDRRLRLLDVGCSYGVNAALLKFDVSMDELYDRYAAAPGGPRGAGDASTPGRAAAGRAALVAADRALARARRGLVDLDVIGLDASGAALDYALDAEFLDDALYADLETREPTEAERARLAGVDLVVSTGCLGYVTGRTLARIVGAAAGTAAGDAEPQSLPWMAHFTLRMFPFDPIAATLAGFGYETVTVDRYFEQRRFASPRERDQVLRTLANVGVDPTGLEADGWLYAQLFISRPPASALDRGSQ
jgi:carnitine O-acetyltransferase